MMSFLTTCTECVVGLVMIALFIFAISATVF